jgi:TolB-like protein
MAGINRNDHNVSTASWQKPWGKKFSLILSRCLSLILFSGWLAAAPDIYLYLIPFENIQNDPDTDWLRRGFMDMLVEHFKDQDGIHVKNEGDLEAVMSNRNLLLHQPRGSKNFLVLGKYDRALDELKVTVQIINIANWEEIGTRKVAGSYSDVSALGKSLTDVVNSLIKPYLPEQKKVTGIYPELIIPRREKPRSRFAEQSKELTRSIDVAVDLLEESMDLAVGAREEPPDKPEGAEGEWVMDLNVDHEYMENPENAANTELLLKVLDNLTRVPYKVRFKSPQFDYYEDQDDQMQVTFPVTYSLKENLINDMLLTLPYSGLKQDGSLTIFYFNKDRFNFPPELVDKIRFGNYRSVPVIRFFNEAGKPVVVIVDTPELIDRSALNPDVMWIFTHHFSPLIDFTLGGWSMQIAMETVDIPVNYSFTMGLDAVRELSRVSLKFVPVTELQSFLEKIR